MPKHNKPSEQEQQQQQQIFKELRKGQIKRKVLSDWIGKFGQRF
jgi:hypothetical protein